MPTMYLFDDEDSGELTPRVAAAFLREFDEILAGDPREIRIKLMTSGGSEDAAFAIYDAIKSTDARVVVEGVGYVQSAGVLVLQAADHRVLHPNTYLLLHMGEIALAGPMSEVANCASYYQHRDERAFRILADRAHISYEDIVAHHRSGLMVPAGQAVKWGYADEVASPVVRLSNND